MIALLASFLVLAYGFTLSGTYSLGKLLAVAVGGLWLALGNTYRREGDWRLLAYLAVLAVTACVSVDPWTGLWGLFGTYQTGLLAALVLVPYWAGLDERDRPALELGLRWAGAALAVTTLIQRYAPVPAGTPFLLPQELPAGHRAYAPLGAPPYLGAAIVLLLPYAGSPLEILALLAALGATGSRGAWVAAALGAVYRFWPRLPARARVGALLLAGTGAAGALTMRPPSDLGRIAVWHAALRAYAARPVAGWGPGTYIALASLYRNPVWDEVYGATTQDHAHNLVLEAAATSGTLGLLGLGLLLWALWRAAADRRARTALLGVGVVGLLNPLPLVVKALALAIAASGSRGAPAARVASRGAAVLACNTFVMAVYLVCLDRLMTIYGDAPWSYSSVEAAFQAGVLRVEPVRRAFKL